jgi:hypothetical protein
MVIEVWQSAHLLSKVVHGELGLVHNGHQTMSSYLVE